MARPAPARSRTTLFERRLAPIETDARSLAARPLTHAPAAPALRARASPHTAANAAEPPARLSQAPQDRSFTSSRSGTGGANVARPQLHRRGIPFPLTFNFNFARPDRRTSSPRDGRTTRPRTRHCVAALQVCYAANVDTAPAREWILYKPTQPLKPAQPLKHCQHSTTTTYDRVSRHPPLLPATVTAAAPRANPVACPSPQCRAPKP